MQQPRLCRQTRPNNPLQITPLIPLNLRHRIPITSPSNQRRGVDDRPTQFLDALPEPWQSLCSRPDVVRRVLGRIREAVCGGGLQGGVLVEGAVDVVGALQRVEVAGAEGFFAAGPADEVFRGWTGEGFY